MKSVLMAMAFLAFTLSATSCSYFDTKIVPVIITPLEDAGCAVETAAAIGFATSVSIALTCKNTAAIQASVLTALGNANLCTIVQTQVSMKKKGIFGNILCPVAINTIIGYLTSQVPAAWGCSSGATVSQLSTVLTAACEAAAPI